MPGKSKEKIVNVFIKRNEGCAQPLGLNIIGGSEHEMDGVYIHSIDRDGLAFGQVMKDDEIIEINGNIIPKGSTRASSVELVKACKGNISLKIKRNVREGFLVKQGGSIKSWKKRYFILDGSKLSYYKSADHLEALGVIDLMEVSSMDKLVLLEKDKRHGFCLRTPNRTYIMVAETADEQEEWLYSLSSFITSDYDEDGNETQVSTRLSNADGNSIISQASDLNPRTSINENNTNIRASASSLSEDQIISALKRQSITSCGNNKNNLKEKEISYKHGYLIKSNSDLSSWRKRYFILENKTLSYYKNESTSQNVSKALGTIDLDNVTSVGPYDGNAAKKYEHVMYIETPERVYFVVCRTAADRRSWIVEIGKNTPENSTVWADEVESGSVVCN